MFGREKGNTLTHIYDSLNGPQRDAVVAVLNQYPSNEITPRIDRFLAREMLLNIRPSDDALNAFAQFAVMEGTRVSPEHGAR